MGSQMVQKFKETGHPLFTSVSALSRGIRRRMKGKDSIHMNANVLNAELLFKIIFSTNQLSICGAVSNWCYQFGLQEGEEHEIATAQETLCTEILKSVNAEEGNSSVPSPRTTLASGNRLSEHLKTFKCLPKESQFSMLCDLASFWKRVEAGDNFITKPSTEHGWNGLTLQCREFRHTFSRTSLLQNVCRNSRRDNNWTSH